MLVFANLLADALRPRGALLTGRCTQTCWAALDLGQRLPLLLQQEKDGGVLQQGACHTF